MTETELQKQCNEYLRTRGIHFFHLQAGGQHGNKRVQCGGLPDLLLWYRGQHCLIELKTLTGKLNDKQREEFKKFFAVGYVVYVCHSFEEFQCVVDEFMKGEA